jgi:hypothetical protein
VHVSIPTWCRPAGSLERVQSPETPVYTSSSWNKHSANSCSVPNIVCQAIGIPGLHRNALLCQTCLSIHIVVLSIVVIYRRRCWLLLFEQLFPVKRAGRVELEPGPYAVQIKVVVLVAGQLHDERILVFPESELAKPTTHMSRVNHQLTFKKWVDADWAGIGRL